MCVYCYRLVLSSVQSQPRGGREGLEKAYITVSIVTCSIVPKGETRSEGIELQLALRQQQVEMTLNVRGVVKVVKPQKSCKFPSSYYS